MKSKLVKIAIGLAVTFSILVVHTMEYNEKTNVSIGE